jgi:hypothetical protein
MVAAERAVVYPVARDHLLKVAVVVPVWPVGGDGESWQCWRMDYQLSVETRGQARDHHGPPWECACI